MQRPDELDYISRMLEMARANRRDDAPSITHAPVDAYISQERFEREVQTLFRRHPVVVAFSAQVRKPGDFVTSTDTGQPILVVRGKDMKLRAFLNVCRHRTATVETKPCGSNKRAFVCPYHGWSYDLTGKLVGITDGAWFGDIDRSAHGLKQLAVAEHCGLVWVVPTALQEGQSADIDLDAQLGPVKADLDSWDMSGWEVQSITPIRPRMNWKLVIDTFLELYHFRYLHGASVAPLFLDNITTYERRDRHSRFAVAKTTLLEIDKEPREKWRLLDHAVMLYNLFPHTVLAYTADHCGVFTSYPISPDEALINVTVLVDPAVRATKHEDYWKKNQDLILAALAEDFAVGASIQANFRSGANVVQTFGKFEKALGWYHKEIDDALSPGRPATN
ncbi:MAG: Rieske 2Fe-2S domain-containing protein [Proteobacteria bacterium]|nr:Rieske 2Fe-2S domain-containing protein [Pseudomonadota bacterium]